MLDLHGPLVHGGGYDYTSFFGNKNQYNVQQNASDNRKYLQKVWKENDIHVYDFLKKFLCVKD